MCIAVMVTKGHVLTEEVVDRCWRRNPDGAGFAWANNGKVEINKGYLKLDDFKDSYFTKAKDADSNMLVHFRIGTSGLNNADNTHPFRIKDGAMIHNGVLFHPEGPKSDTHVLVNRLFNKLNRVNILECSEQLAKAIGGGNKLAFLFDDGSYHMVNEDSGNWDTDKSVWFSNSTWKS